MICRSCGSTCNVLCLLFLCCAGADSDYGQILVILLLKRGSCMYMFDQTDGFSQSRVDKSNGPLTYFYIFILLFSADILDSLSIMCMSPVELETVTLYRLLTKSMLLA